MLFSEDLELGSRAKWAPLRVAASKYAETVWHNALIT